MKAPAKQAPPGDTAEDATFVLRMRPAGPYKAGELGRFVVELEPRDPYHINQEFPMLVELETQEGLALPKRRFERVDAARFDEQRARFDVPFTAERAGQHAVRAQVSFAVCTDETCIPEERTLALAIAVRE